MSFDKTKTDAEWRAELSPEQFRILREHGTEQAFSGEFWDNQTALGSDPISVTSFFPISACWPLQKGDGNCQSMPQRGRTAEWDGAAAISGLTLKTVAESMLSGLSVQFFPTISKVGTAPAR